VKIYPVHLIEWCPRRGNRLEIFIQRQLKFRLIGLIIDSPKKSVGSGVFPASNSVITLPCQVCRCPI